MGQQAKCEDGLLLSCRLPSERCTDSREPFLPRNREPKSSQQLRHMLVMYQPKLALPDCPAFVHFAELRVQSSGKEKKKGC